MGYARPNGPLGGEVRDAHVVNTAPSEIGEVSCDDCLVVRVIKGLVHEFRHSAVLRRCYGSTKCNSVGPNLIGT